VEVPLRALGSSEVDGEMMSIAKTVEVPPRLGGVASIAIYTDILLLLLHISNITPL
jgi:hypothetical protein